MNAIKPDWPAPDFIHAYTTLRTEWGNPSADIKSRQERDKLISQLSLPSDPIWLNQVHGNKALKASATIKDTVADASYTREMNQVCLIITADCIPVLMCDKQGTQVAALHAGWRGLANGVIENTIKAMGVDPENLMVWLGPAIGPERFEVGPDVYTTFTTNDDAAKSHFKPSRDGKWMANLYGLASLRLGRLGITSIYGGNYCTHTQDDMFYSYRRDGAKTGRMATLVWIGKS